MRSGHFYNLVSVCAGFVYSRNLEDAPFQQNPPYNEPAQNMVRSAIRSDTRWGEESPSQKNETNPAVCGIIQTAASSQLTASSCSGGRGGNPARVLLSVVRWLCFFAVLSLRRAAVMLTQLSYLSQRTTHCSRVKPRFVTLSVLQENVYFVLEIKQRTRQATAAK